MWQVRGSEFDFWFWPCDLTSCMWQARGPWLVFGHSLGQFWVHWSGLVFCGMSISRFWLNLVHGVGWFEFWKLIGLENLVWSNQLKRGMEPFFLYALGKRKF